jgi:2',3'-cyclic-nucleotide 2'-phosphodiesterase (5'-nucleotidase family)
MSFMKKIWILFFFSFLLIACKNNSHEISKINAKQLKIGNDIKQDSSIIQLFTPYKKKMTKEITKSLSFSPKILERTDGNLQSTLGNLVADLSYEKANELFKNKTGKTVDFSMSNYGGIRAAIMKGDVTVSNAFELMPFDNTIVVVELNYDEIKALFNYFVVNKIAHPLSKNIQLTIENDSYNLLINGKTIKKHRTYFVATSNYLQKGGDGMIFFSEPESLFNSNFLIRDAIVDYFKSKDTLRANLDNRVIVN